MYIYHIGPYRSFLEVDLYDLEELGIRNIISSNSYRNGALVMLEKGRDIPLFISAYKKKFGCEPWISERYSDEDSPVRFWGNYY
jgi:hypothetical protein